MPWSLAHQRVAYKLSMHFQIPRQVQLLVNLSVVLIELEHYVGAVRTILQYTLTVAIMSANLTLKCASLVFYSSSSLNYCL